MTVRLSEVLRELADARPRSDDPTDDTEAARGAWARSRRVRRRRRVAGAAVAVVAALLVVPIVSSLSGLGADRPLPGGVPGVVGVPDRLYEPPDLVPSAVGGTGTPAALAVVSRLPQRIAGWDADGSGEQGGAPVFVSATSDLYTGFPGGAEFVALSPDGRHVVVVSPMDTTIGSILATVDLVSGTSVVATYPDWSVSAVLFSPDGSQLAISAGLRITGSDSGTRGHVYVRYADGTTQDLGESSGVFGWMPSGREVVMSGLGGVGRPEVRAVSVDEGKTPSIRVVGPYVDASASQGASALSPDGRLVAVAGLKGNVSNTVSPFILTVTRLRDAKVVRTVEVPSVYNAQLVGWQDETTPVLAVWSPDPAVGFAVVAEAADGPVTLTSGPAAMGSQNTAAAQDLLSTVRPAGPPDGVAWYRDWHASVWHVSAWMGMTPGGMQTFLIVLGLIAVPVVLLLLNNRRVKRRHPEAYIP